jgi:hypothetical protein
VNLGAPELVIVAVPIVSVGVVLWGLIDAAVRPDPAWAAAGQNKTVWVVLQVVGLFFCAIGLILSLVYLLAIRPRVRAAQLG